MTKNQLILMMTQIEWVWRWENMYMYKYVPIKPLELWTKSVHSSINKYGNFIIFDDVMTPFDKICHNLWLMFSVLRDDRNHTNLHHWELYLFINRVCGRFLTMPRGESSNMNHIISILDATSWNMTLTTMIFKKSDRIAKNI